MMNMVMMSKQKKARFILKQLKNKPRLHLLLKKRVVFRKPRSLEMVDAETNERIGQALANIKAGNYIEVAPENIRNHFRNLFQKNDLQD